MAKIIDGKALAAQIREEVKDSSAQLRAKGVIPRLSVILIGEDPASQIYVRNKEKGCVEVGFESEVHRLSSETSEEKVISLVQKLNNDKKTHGILLQLPLPKGIDEKRILAQISPEKDVDGLHYENVGKLFKGEDPLFVPCTPKGIIELILSTGVEIKGREAVVVGRSNIVGKPVSILLLNAHATVTICHSKTQDLGEVVSRGDIVVAAVGKPKIIKGDMIKPGAVVIDVGMNRLETGLVGDVDFESAKNKASYISPVPGGVGPMTIAMLLKNTIISAERSLKYHSA